MCTARKRAIRRKPDSCNYFLVDANFLVNRYLRTSTIKDAGEQERIRKSQEWWAEIDAQLALSRAKVYVPDLCIAEAFKCLAKKYYVDNAFKRSVDYKRAKERLHRDVHLTSVQARSPKRTIRFHDLQTTRDVIIAVDRFFEPANKTGASVSITDLLLLASAKYLTDFYGFSDGDLFVITQDGHLYELARKLRDVPYTFNPLRPNDAAAKVFV